jgi:hypothetical protein
MPQVDLIPHPTCLLQAVVAVVALILALAILVLVAVLVVYYQALKHSHQVLYIISQLVEEVLVAQMDLLVQTDLIQLHSV